MQIKDHKNLIHNQHSHIVPYKQEILIGWSFLLMDWCKFNVDGSLFTHGVATCGGILRTLLGNGSTSLLTIWVTAALLWLNSKVFSMLYELLENLAKGRSSLNLTHWLLCTWLKMVIMLSILTVV